MKVTDRNGNSVNVGMTVKFQMEDGSLGKSKVIFIDYENMQVDLDTAYSFNFNENGVCYLIHVSLGNEENNEEDHDLL